MLWIYRFFNGFVKVKITGELPERLINKCVKNNIILWNIKYLKNGIIFKISIRDFKRLFAIRKGYKIRVNIERKYGFPFIRKRYKNRYGIFLGIILFAFVIYFLSGFVWNIEINGNKKIEDSNILSKCETLGIKIGAKKSDLNTKILAEKLLINSEELAWAALNMEGCVLTIDVTEAKTNSKGDETNPTNIKARCDGVITKIDVSSGNCLVKVGQRVSKGDVLVSGILENSYSTEFVHSSGNILAVTEKEYLFEEKFNQNITVKTKKCINKNVLSFFGINLPLYLGNPKNNFVETNYESKYILGNKIPILIYRKTFSETKKENINHSKEFLTEKMQNSLSQKLKDDRVKKYEIIYNSIKEKKESIVLKVKIKTEESIGVQDILLFDSAK